MKIPQAKNKAFALPGTLAICVLLMALSGGLLMRSTQARLGMRTMAVANQYQMSMDSVLRQFGTMASEMAVLGASGQAGGGAGASPLQSFSDPNAMTRGIRNALPLDWTTNALVTANVSVSHWSTNGTTIVGNPSLMTDPASGAKGWRLLRTGDLRSSLLPPGQMFIGRSWGYRAQVDVSVQDNLAGVQTSWQRNANTGGDIYITNATGVLYSNRVSSFMTITEIPTQFGVQGQNLALTNTAHLARTKIGAGGGRASTILGRTVDMSTRVASSSGLLRDTKVVARGGIARRGGQSWSDIAHGGATSRAIAASAEAGSSAMTDLEEAGSAVLVNVGTRGREIFRAPQDYLPILTSAGRMPSSTNSASAGIDEFLKYWLPYYQCNFRVAVSFDKTNDIRHTGGAAMAAGVSAVEFVLPNDRGAPSSRDRVVSLTNTSIFPRAPRGFGELRAIIQPEAKSALHNLAGNGNARPINVVMRAISTRNKTGGGLGGAPKTWVNTVDIDLDSFTRLLETMPRPPSIPAAVWTNLPIALHVDIRGPNGAMFDAAESVPVVIRKAKTLRRPVSIVTPGTLYIQGKFGSDRLPGRPMANPFSLFAPKVKFGMEGRQPATVNIKGQRVGVGGGTNRETDILSVAAGERGTGGADVQVMPGRVRELLLSNIRGDRVSGAAMDQVLPPVFLKDWLIETYNNF